MSHLEDIIKAVVVLFVGIAIMSSLATLPGGESLANLGKLMMVTAFIVGIISFLVPFIKKFT